MREKHYWVIKNQIKKFKHENGINPFTGREICESEEMERNKVENRRNIRRHRKWRDNREE